MPLRPNVLKSDCTVTRTELLSWWYTGCIAYPFDVEVELEAPRMSCDMDNGVKSPLFNASRVWTGRIPVELGNMAALEHLDRRQNKLSGE